MTGAELRKMLEETLSEDVCWEAVEQLGIYIEAAMPKVSRGAFNGRFNQGLEGPDGGAV